MAHGYACKEYCGAGRRAVDYVDLGGYMSLVDCEDQSCKHNDGGYCKCWCVEMRQAQEHTLEGPKTVLVCRSYEDGRDGTD